MGYPKEIFVNEKDASMLECPVCFSVVKDPRSDLCGHTFCLECITNSISINGTCPLSKCPLTKNELIKIYMFAEVLKSKEVKCVSRSLGCEWEGLLESYDQHQEKVCPFAIVPCSFSGCTEKITRSKLKEHEPTCEYRSEACKHCNEQVQIAKTEEHLAICPEFIVECPRSCDVEVRRKDLQNHEASCPNKEANCRLKEFGCTFTGRLRDMEGHSKENYKEHEQLLRTVIGQLQKEVSAAKSTLEKEEVKIQKKVSSAKLKTADQKKEPEPPKTARNTHQKK